MDAAKSVSEPLQGFMVDSVRLVRRCNKPDRKEFLKISTATAVGFAVMGFIGFFVRLIHIPVNSILLDFHGYICTSSYDFAMYIAGMALLVQVLHIVATRGAFVALTKKTAFN